MPTHKKNTLLKAAKGNVATKAFKRVFFSPPQKSTLPFFTNLFFPTHGFTTKTNCCESNVNLLGQSVCNLDTIHLRADRRASANSGFKKLAVKCLIEHVFFVSSAVLADSFVLRNRQLLKPTNRQTVQKRLIN
jgi:hypothetical protein